MRLLRLLPACIGIILPAATAAAAQAQSTSSTARPVTVRVEEATKLGFDLSPDGRSLLLDVFGQLWTLSSAGGAATPLMDAIRERSDAREPRYAPDGASVLYRREGRLSRLALATGQSEALPAVASQLAAPAWHPHGSELVGIRWNPDAAAPQEQIVRFHLGTGTVTPLQADSLLGAQPGRLLMPAWSPDGRHLAVVVIPSLDFVESGAVWEVEAATGAVRRMMPEGWVGRTPAYSPDGAWLAFIGGASEDEHQLHVVRRADGVIRRLTDMPPTLARSLYRFGRVAWTPDGQRLIYAWEGRLFEVAVDGGASREIRFAASISFDRAVPELPPIRFADPGTEQRARGFTGLALSADGQRAALLALDRLWILSGDGVVQASIPVQPGAAGLSWAPDGSALVWSAGPRGEEDLYVTDVASATSRRLPALDGREIRATWSPDGQHIAFLHYAPTGVTPARTIRVVPAAATLPDQIRQLGPIPPGIRGGPTSPVLEIVPQWTADGSAIRIHTRSGAATLIPLEGERSTIALPDDAWFVRWLTDDSIVFIRGSQLHTAGLQAGSGEPAAATLLDADPALYPTIPARDGSLLYVGEQGLVIRRADGRAVQLGWPVQYRVPDVEPLVVHNVRVLDTASGSVSDPADVRVVNGRVAGITPAGQTRRTGGVRWIDAGGRIAVPGLIDAHTHPMDETELRGMLYYGVTTARTMGGLMANDAALRDAVAAGAGPGPRLVTSGSQFVTACEGECWTNEWGQWSRDEAAMLRGLALAQAFGSGLIKLYHSGNYAAAVALVEAAHGRGLRVAAHDARALPLLAAGIDAEEHTGSFAFEQMQSDLIALVAASRLPITSTMTALVPFLTHANSAVDADGRPFLTPVARAAFGVYAADGPARNAVLVQQRLHLHNVGRLHRAGAAIAAGTDAPGLPAAIHMELERLVDAGLSTQEALAAATVHAARMLGAEAEVGSITPGRRADLLILDADPLADIRNARRIWLLIQGGRVIDRDALRAGPGPGSPSSR